MIDQRERILGGLWGSLVGDALGVPVEFRDRVSIQSDPVSDMRGHGTHDHPPGTWSDDGSLVLCTVDSLVQTKFDLEDMGRRFEQWLRYGLWTLLCQSYSRSEILLPSDARYWPPVSWPQIPDGNNGPIPRREIFYPAT